MPKEILFATNNLSKKFRFQSYFGQLGLIVKSFEDVCGNVSVPEDGKTPEENALKKAMVGFNNTGMPTFGVDYWFAIDGLSEDRQPGPYVRRIIVGKSGNREEANDEQLLNYYKGIASELGGRASGVWTSAIALVVSKHKYFTERFTSNTLIVDELCKFVMPGEPMNSIQIDPITGKYLAELTKDEWMARQNNQETGYLEFMKTHLSDL